MGGRYKLPYLPPAIGQIVPPQSFYKDDFGIKWSMKVDMPLNKEIK